MAGNSHRMHKKKAPHAVGPGILGFGFALGSSCQLSILVMIRARAISLFIEELSVLGRSRLNRLSKASAGEGTYKSGLGRSRAVRLSKNAASHSVLTAPQTKKKPHIHCGAGNFRIQFRTWQRQNFIMIRTRAISLFTEELSGIVPRALCIWPQWSLPAEQGFSWGDSLPARTWPLEPPG